jgi:hypothetical protein
VLGGAARIRVVLAQAQDGIVFEEAIEHVYSASRGEQEMMRVPNTEYRSKLCVYAVTARS